MIITNHHNRLVVVHLSKEVLQEGLHTGCVSLVSHLINEGNITWSASNSAEDCFAGPSTVLLVENDSLGGRRPCRLLAVPGMDTRFVKKVERRGRVEGFDHFDVAELRSLVLFLSLQFSNTKGVDSLVFDPLFSVVLSQRPGPQLDLEDPVDLLDALPQWKGRLHL